MFFGIRDLPYLKAGIWDFNENWRRDSGLKVCMEYEMPKITIGITGLRENWVGIIGLKNLIGTL